VPPTSGGRYGRVLAIRSAPVRHTGWLAGSPGRLPTPLASAARGHPSIAHAKIF